MLERLPDALKIEVLKHRHGAVMDNFPFFVDKPWPFLWAVLGKVERKLFDEGDLLYR